MTIKERITALRTWMERYDLYAYIIPANDPHQSEYVAAHWKMREWISGFTGSAGTVVVTQDHAGLWTDSRYFLQAREELMEGGLALHKLVNHGEPEYVDWLCEEMVGERKVGIDGLLFSIENVRDMKHVFAKEKIELVVLEDPFQEIWSDRPVLPTGEIFEVAASSTGATRQERIRDLSEKLYETGCTALLITALDEIAWLLNLRGRDVDCNPVFVAYALVVQEEVTLFVDQVKVSKKLQAILAQNQVQIRSYESIVEALQSIGSDETILVDQHLTSYTLFHALSSSKTLEAKSPITLMKAIKNPIEQEHLRQVMVKDGVALLKAFRALEKALEEGKSVTEAEFADMLASYRGEQSDYFGESFNAIIGYKGNGAIVHYRPEHGKSADIQQDGILLVDSGGQYLDGTTDITRTIHLGQPSSEEKKYYTLVLQGHIALARAKFPEGTRGVQLDVLARQFLWEEMANYGHGTGHGVGYFMNVHEPPQGFVSGLNERGKTAHQPGMYSSNEPGFYKENEYGIRIENLILCQEAGETDSGRFLQFETITLFPIDTNLIDMKRLNSREVIWLNEYHKQVFDQLSRHLNDEEKAWLKEKCKPI